MTQEVQTDLAVDPLQFLPLARLSQKRYTQGNRLRNPPPISHQQEEKDMSKQPLTFEKFRVWQVVVPARQDIVAAPVAPGVMYRFSGQWPQMPVHLVEGTTSQGFTAVGESGRGTTRAVVDDTLRDLLGRDLSSITPATAWQGAANASGLPRSYPYWSWELAEGRSYSLLESLWLDAVGKAVGMPAHQLLGGAIRSQVSVDFWVNRPAASDLAKLIHEAVGLGLRGIKMKSSAGGDTVQALLAIGADIPEDFHITIDPMCAWRSLRECARQLEKLAQLPFDIQIEDPFPYGAIEDWRAIRQISPLTIACHARTEDVGAVPKTRSNGQGMRR